jgi:hypothetical protein
MEKVEFRTSALKLLRAGKGGRRQDRIRDVALYSSCILSCYYRRYKRILERRKLCTLIAHTGLLKQHKEDVATLLLLEVILS